MKVNWTFIGLLLWWFVIPIAILLTLALLGFSDIDSNAPYPELGGDRPRPAW